jgi:ADP-heptose:LPS heptosyltransferase
VVTGDTLALHAALGLGKRVVALFGPTSAAEIDTYGLGAKIVPDLECTCCYRPECNRRPSCMDSIQVEQVAGALMDQLRSVSAPSLLQYCVVGEPGRPLEFHG